MWGKGGDIPSSFICSTLFHKKGSALKMVTNPIPRSACDGRDERSAADSGPSVGAQVKLPEFIVVLVQLLSVTPNRSQHLTIRLSGVGNITLDER